MTPSRRRPVVNYLHETYRVSERRACRVARLPASTFHYASQREPRTALRLRIREIAQTSSSLRLPENPGAAEP